MRLQRVRVCASIELRRRPAVRPIDKFRSIRCNTLAIEVTNRAARWLVDESRSLVPSFTVGIVIIISIRFFFLSHVSFIPGRKISRVNWYYPRKSAIFIRWYDELFNRREFLTPRTAHNPLFLNLKIISKTTNFRITWIYW